MSFDPTKILVTGQGTLHPGPYPLTTSESGELYLALKINMLEKVFEVDVYNPAIIYAILEKHRFSNTCTVNIVGEYDSDCYVDEETGEAIMRHKIKPLEMEFAEGIYKHYESSASDSAFKCILMERAYKESCSNTDQKLQQDNSASLYEKYNQAFKVFYETDEDAPKADDLNVEQSKDQKGKQAATATSQSRTESAHKYFPQYPYNQNRYDSYSNSVNILPLESFVSSNIPSSYFIQSAIREQERLKADQSKAIVHQQQQRQEQLKQQQERVQAIYRQQEQLQQQQEQFQVIYRQQQEQLKQQQERVQATSRQQ